MSDMELDELMKLGVSKDLSDFTGEDVSERIESLSRKDLIEIERHREFVPKLENDVRQLQAELSSRFVGRDELIEIALAAFVAHLPMIALGPPGTAKSLVFRELSRGLGLQESPLPVREMKGEIDQIIKKLKDNPHMVAQQPREYFEYLVTRYTTPDEILGPPNLSMMIDGALFYRQTDGLLPEAQVAFLDEIFKANSAILNALLSILNERIFYNAGRPVKVPMCMVFGASNEGPQDESLWALFDRFPVRVVCSPVEDSFGNLERLLHSALDHATAGLFGEGEQRAMPTLATVNHFRLLHRVIHVRYKIDEEKKGRKNDYLEAYINTFRALKREYQISDRSMFLLFRLSWALALLRDRGDRPLPEELQVFKFCFRDSDAAPGLEDAVEDRIRAYRN